MPEERSRKPLRHSDLELVTQAREGRREVVQEFLDRMKCVPRILAAKNARLGGPLAVDELEDVVQETLVAVWKKLPTYNGTSSLETWVYSFCHFELLKCLTRKKKQNRMKALEGESITEPQAPETRCSLQFEHVHESLESLEPEISTVIRLKYFEGLTLEAIGQRLRISPNTVKTRYYRGLKQLGGVIKRREVEISGEGRS